MKDISRKKSTLRTAKAKARIRLRRNTFEQLLFKGSPKGDVFEVSRVAGVMAAKMVPQLVPFCHPIDLTKVEVVFDVDQKKHTVTAVAEVACYARTGVEMEALTAATAAVLSIYDMMKWNDKSMVIEEIHLLKKTGGKSANYERKE